jgi:HK97 family phage prohead protease
MPTPTETALRKPAFQRIKPLPFQMEKAEADTTASGRKKLTIEGWGSTEEEDRDKEFIHVGFFDGSLKAFMQNPVMPWNHQYGDVQGRWLSVEPVEGKGYAFKGELHHYGTDFDERRLAQVEEGDVSMLSVGFDGDYTERWGDRDKADKWHWRENGELIECSICTIPSNPGAGFEVAKAMGLLIEPPPEWPAVKPTEDERCLNDIERLRGAAESIRNIVKHWATEEGAPSPRVLDAIGSPILTLCEVVKAGEVLSAANLSDIMEAQRALESVTGRHEAARARRDPQAEAEAVDGEDDTKAFDLLSSEELISEMWQELSKPVDFFTAGAEAILRGEPIG